MRNTSPSNIPTKRKYCGPDALQIKIRNTRFRSDLLGKFQR